MRVWITLGELLAAGASLIFLREKNHTPSQPALVDDERPRRRPRSWFWTVAFPIVMVLIVIAIPMLLLAGRKTVLQSTDGKVLTEVTDPNLPNWQALTEPTPTLLLVQTGDDGTPVGLTVMSLTGDGAGGLVFVPMSTVLDLPDIGKLPLNVVAEKAGIDGLQKAVEGILGAGMTEVRVVSPQQWADLVAPVGTITVANPDDVFVADAKGQKKVLFPKGQLNLEPKDVAAYLATTSPGESDLNRLERQKVFWEAYLRKVSASTDPSVVPGEKETGLGRFVRALADDRVEMFPLPVQPVAIPGSTSELYLPVKDQVSSIVARLIPFPIGSPPGARPRVRLLDGTGKLEHGLAAAPLVVEGGGQIDQIGNGPTLDQAVTQLVYYDDAQRPAAEALQKALGLGEVVKGTSAGSAVDVTITIGKDYLAQPARVLTPVSTVPRGSATTTIVGAGG